MAKSTLSLWLRDVPLTEDQQRALDLRGPAATGKNSEAERADATRRRSIVQAQAKAQITPERE